MMSTFVRIKSCHNFGMAIRIFDLPKMLSESVSLIRSSINWPKLLRAFRNVFSTFYFAIFGTS